jgi:hypothetical protein
MYVGGLLNNVEQHANIDHNNDVDNHVNLGLATVQFCLKYVSIFVTNRFLAIILQTYEKSNIPVEIYLFRAKTRL